MPRNGSGTYSVPNTFTPNTDILSSEVNANFSDVGTEMTGSLAIDGQSVMTGQLKAANGTVGAPGLTFGSDLNNGLYRIGADSWGASAGGSLVGQFSKSGSDYGAFLINPAQEVESAATCDIGAALSEYVHISGEEAITSFGTAAAGIFRRGIFSAVLTLTYHATDLILPGGQSITTAAGDTFGAVSNGAGVWRVLWYTRASGLPVLPVNDPRVFAANFVKDGGGAVLTTGILGDIVIPVAATIIGVYAYVDTSTDMVIDLWKDTHANFPPTDADSITASAPPTLTADLTYSDTTLTGWTTSIAAGDVIRVNLDSINNATRLLLSLRMRRT